jgi:hypothetical protein
MTPLQVKIITHQADNDLLRIINDLERMQDRSAGEDETLQLAWNRLNDLTRPMPHLPLPKKPYGDTFLPRMKHP